MTRELLRMAMGFVTGAVLGTQLVTVFYLGGAVGSILGLPDNGLTLIPATVAGGVAAVGTGMLVALIAGRFEILIAAGSVLAGLVSLLLFFLSLDLGEGDPFYLTSVLVMFWGIPLVLLAAYGGVLGRGRALERGTRSRRTPL